MSSSECNEIRDFISDIQSINPEHAEIIKLVSDLFIDEYSGLVSGIKYNGLVFFQDKTLIGGIFPYKNHLSIEFSNGAHFDDPSSVLEGKGKKRRHLKIYGVGDIVAKNAKYLVKQAVSEKHE